MNTLYLHIGTPKTGTTYIQNFLAKNNSVLKKNGYVYPDFPTHFDRIGRNRNAHFLVSILRDESGNRLYEKEKEIEKQCLEYCDELFQQYPNVVLSDELIWNAAETNHGNNFWLDLKRHFDKRNIVIKVVVYLRRQDLYIQSSWAQQVKRNNLPLTIQEYIATKAPILDYYDRLMSIASVIGKENIIVRAYESRQYIRGMISADFIHSIGLTYDVQYTELEEPANYSLTGVYLSVKQEIDKTGALDISTDELIYLLRTIMKKNHDERSISSNEFMPYEECVSFLAQYQKSNEAVAKKFLRRKDGLLFLDQIQNENNSCTYTVSDYVKILTQMINLQQEKLHSANEKIVLLKNQVNESQKSAVTSSKPSVMGNFLRKCKNMIKRN